MIRLLFLLIIAFCFPAHAAILSEHDRQDMALQRAIQLCQAKGGTFTWSNTQRFRLEDTPTGYIIRGNELLLVCTVRTSPTTGRIELNWSHPRTRVDGSVLPLNQIAGYEIGVNGQLTTVGVVTTWTTGELPAGNHRITHRTLDIFRQKSPEMPALTVRI